MEKEIKKEIKTEKNNKTVKTINNKDKQKKETKNSDIKLKKVVDNKKDNDEKKVNTIESINKEEKTVDNTSVENGKSIQTKEVIVENENSKEEKKQKKDKKTTVFKTLEVVTLVLITCIVSLVMGYLISYNLYNKKDNTKINKNRKEIETLIETYNYINDNYYGEVSKEQLINKAIEAMINSLQDPYSTYFDEASSENFNITLEGNYKGIGIEIYNNSEGNITISKVFGDSPAEKAGMKSGDVITTVNGVNYLGKTTTEFVSVVRNGTEKEFTIIVERNRMPQTLTLTKEEITIKSVESKIYEENGKKIGYMDVSIFANNTYGQFKTELEKLEKQNIDSLIIDLRDNTGGHLASVKSILELFLDSSNVLYQTQDKNQTKKIYSKGTSTKKYPIVLISNKNSASASEIMLAALSENYGATIIGINSYGKGTIQELKTLPTGEQYKFTTKKWLTPKGNWINSVGVTPNHIIELNEEYYTNPTEETDNQLQKALEMLKK